MKWRGPLFVVALAAVIGTGGCSAGPAASTSCSAAPSAATSVGAAQPWQVDPYSRTSEILVDGSSMGWLIEYQPIPAGADSTRVMPAGSYRIQGRDFEDVGFITGHGQFFRHVDGGSQSLGNWPLEEGLLRFFGGTRRVTLAALQPSAPKRAAPAAPAEGEGADAGTGDGGEASDEVDEGS